MSRRRLWLPSLLSLTTLVAATALSAAPPAKTPADAARLATYQKPSGESYFALSVQANLPDTSSQGRDVVVLFDTSASQTAGFREDGLDALEELLKGLGEKDRVRIVAVDLNAVPMQDKFAPAGGEAVATAVAKLDARVPLGSTDMIAGLRAAEASFEDSSANARAVIYIGDGVSRARVLGGPQLESLSRDLVAKRISVSSFAVGPQVNLPLLAAIANQTGGLLVSAPQDASTAQPTVSPQQVGAHLAAAVRETVAWPTATQLPEALKDALPTTIPPLRSDRDTVLVGKLAEGDVGSLKVTAEVSGKPVAMQWPLKAEKSNEEFTFLPRLVELMDAGG